MTSREIRQKFLDFYAARGHAVIPSASIIPENDSTLLFVNSGMFPLVPYFLGENHPSGVRLADSQKSFRAEDIEEVGDGRHDTLFEMLGNWSLGDYFKKEQLAWWYEFLTAELKLDPKRLYQTVYAGDPSIGVARDEESISLVKNIFAGFGIEAEVGPETTRKGALGPGMPVDFKKVHIMAYRDKSWWERGDAVGELGGPDSETFYDTGKEHDPKFGEHCHLNCDCGRFIEIGNSVFIQYRKTEVGWEELSRKNVDFGGGLERILMAENGFTNIFETDLFKPLIGKIESLSGKKYDDDRKAFEIIADHVKAVSFIIGDDKGIGPSNVGQGYIVRRLIRRAARYGRELGIIEFGWMRALAGEVLKIYEGVYPELKRNFEFIAAEIEKEEEKFEKTLENGLKEFARVAGSEKKLSGEKSFYLYQSFGFPKEDIEELCAKNGIEFDSAGFNDEFERHKDLSRTASAGMFKGGLADSSIETTKFHTAAHLTIAALRKVLGNHIAQKGANITAERLRLDFSHSAKMTPEEIKEVVSLVNKWIEADLPVVAEEMDVEDAKKTGAVGAFGDRYGERVKVYTIGNPENPVSREICGGPHVSRTSEIGGFRVIKEESASAGVRRIKADTAK